MYYYDYRHRQANPNAGITQVLQVKLARINLVAPLLDNTSDDASQTTPKTAKQAALDDAGDTHDQCREQACEDMLFIRCHDGEFPVESTQLEPVHHSGLPLVASNFIAPMENPFSIA